MGMKNLKRRLHEGETLVGCFLNLGSSLTAEIMGRAGYDFAVIDLEHGSGTEAEVLPQLQALGATGAGVIVRVESHERQRAHRVLDLGAEGIMFRG
jgi:4-hydroxy-2-oxoheptanedioate aldolase